ncbi:MAG: nonstructural protein [Microvirus sp.]|nr:MAG: nonstructural protein [Microvirus sp.]
MTTKLIFSVYDRAHGAYANPFYVPTIALAMRSFRDEVNRAERDNLMYTHPEDFELVHLGSWDERTGTFDNIESVCIAKASNLKE